MHCVNQRQWNRYTCPFPNIIKSENVYPRPCKHNTLSLNTHLISQPLNGRTYKIITSTGSEMYEQILEAFNQYIPANDGVYVLGFFDVWEPTIVRRRLK